MLKKEVVKIKLILILKLYWLKKRFSKLGFTLRKETDNSLLFEAVKRYPMLPKGGYYHHLLISANDYGTDVMSYQYIPGSISNDIPIHINYKELKVCRSACRFVNLLRKYRQ